MKKVLIGMVVLATQLAVAAQDVRLAGSANNDFGFALFKNTKTRTDKGNKFLSPVSAYLALSMLYNGAKGQTLAEIQNVLNFGKLSRDRVNLLNHDFIHSLTANKEYTLNIANSLWVKDDFKLNRDFEDNVKEAYHASAARLNFTSPLAVQTINDWVKKATYDTEEKKSLIDEILKEIPAEAVLYLINATYFNADWADQFKSGETWMRDFNVTPKKKVKVPTMSQHGHFKVVVDRGARTIELPYKGDKASMIVIVPEGGNTPDSIAASLTDANWKSLTDRLDKAKSDQYEITLPKLELKYEDLLNESLKAQGMPSAFNDKADLTGISDTKDGHLRVSKVKQKTFLQVDEKGTKAAAVTSIEVVLESAILIQNRFDVDKPYLLAIRDKATNAVLFLGSIQEPEGGKLTPRGQK